MIQANIEDLEKELWLRKRNVGLIGWTTKNGQQIALKDMSDAHLVNTINMIYRNNNHKASDEWLSDEWPWTEFGPGDADNM